MKQNDTRTNLVKTWIKRQAIVNSFSRVLILEFFQFILLHETGISQYCFKNFKNVQLKSLNDDEIFSVSWTEKIQFRQEQQIFQY